MLTTYRIVNISILVALGLCLCAILITYKTNVDPCWLRACCGRDCILCGCTRDVMSILSGDVPTRNALSPLFFAAIAVEFGWRILSSVVSFGQRIVYLDIFIHGFLIAIFMFFSIALVVERATQCL